MGIWFMMLGFNLLIPVIMLIAGKLFRTNAPKHINWIIGYRTAMSMKNEDTWVFAHKYAGSFYWKWGWVVLVFAIIFMLFILGQSVEIVSTAGCILMFLQMKYVEYGTRNPETVILLHGGGLSWWNYREAARLLQEDYHVIAPILDGHVSSLLRDSKGAFRGLLPGYL